MRGAKNRYVYGPVPSRRLGRSLGLDLVPFKTCSYDCIYCQLGRTTNQTTELAEYAPVDAILDEVARRLPLDPTPSFVALAGSGEPTLHSGMGRIIAGLKKITRIPVAVITNGSLLWMPEVRSGLAEADLVMPSLDAGSQRCFEQIDRPHRDISFEKMVDGLTAFAAGYRGKIWLEVFLLGGLNDLPDEITRIASIAKEIGPERVQLNTVSRPSVEDYAHAVPAKRMERLLGSFSSFCETIADGSPIHSSESIGDKNAESEIAALLSRRPCTVEGVSAGLGLLPNEVVKHLDALGARGVIRSERRGGTVFYERVRLS